ncbi:hypothetical protein M0802_011817 [Mischocyttarus mexicanus]|nr:hypothetical protein M0802_011817 [Mischocyttarus mexicanus]
MQHACCQCSIIVVFFLIRSKIRQPFEGDRKLGRNFRCFSTLTDEYNWIVDIANRHRSSLEYVEMLRYLSNRGYFIIFLHLVILTVFNYLCVIFLEEKKIFLNLRTYNIFYYLQILDLSELLKSLRYTIECIVYVVGSLFTIYINFYLGQKLIDHSNSVLQELNNVPFYMLSLNTQKLLLFMIVISKKPYSLTIGSMFISSHEVFASLMRKSLSFAMVYYNVH